MDAWQGWLGLPIGPGGLQPFSLDLILLMLAAGAVVGMVLAVIGLDAWVQVLAAVAASVAALGLVRPSVVKRLHSGPTLVLGHDALVGKTGLVVEEGFCQGGQARIGGA